MASTRRAVTLAALVVAVSTFAACAHSPECSERISNCLGHCPPPEPRAELRGGEDGTRGWERQTDCERRCQSLCGTTRAAAGPSQPVQPASGPLDPPPSQD